MDKAMRDLAWKCQPKEARTYVREMHKSADQEYKFHKGKRYALEMTFGKSNLESYTEPEEMLVVPRKAVMERYHDLKYPSDANYNQTLRNANMLLLQELFGVDKCMPDKEEPKPRFKVEDKVYQTSGHDRLQEYTVKKVYTDGERGIVYDIQGLISIIGVEENNLCRVDQNPYTEENKEPIVSKDDTMDDTKETMEEKELNLCELLKGCEGEKFFSPCYGNVTLSEVRNDRIIVIADVNGKKHSLVPNGSHISNPVASCVMLIPNLGLYQKYPFNPEKSWMEWKESRKPKRWYPKNGEGFWCISPNLRSHYITESDPVFDWESDLNHFQTEELCQQAAEAVREILMKFHSEHSDK